MTLSPTNSSSELASAFDWAVGGDVELQAAAWILENGTKVPHSGGQENNGLNL